MRGIRVAPYGYRDYAPQQARFTTVDPIRDGSNWFSYVNNDSVNYYDEFGLEKKTYKASSTYSRTIPIDYSAGVPSIGLFAVTVTTYVIVDTETHTADVFSNTTTSVYKTYNTQSVTTATVTNSNGYYYDSGFLVPEPYVLPVGQSGLGATTVSVPANGDFSVTTSTTYRILSESGILMVGAPHIVTVKVSCTN